MFEARALTIAALLASGAALAQGQPGDANFCRQYAVTVAIAAEDAIAMNAACRSPSTGVHGDRQMHVDWCLRTASDKVEGASVHIRRLASRCTNNALVTPTEYGGYDIVSGAQFERPYGNARQWEVKAAFSGRLFMYCVAENSAGGASVRLGVDQAMPGDGSQWQLAVPVRSQKDWQGRLEIDGREPAGRAGADVSGSAAAGWSIAWLNMGHVDALRQGKQAVLGVGKQDFDFSLAGVAAAITKVEECKSRRGVVNAVAAPAAQPVQMAQQAPAQPGRGVPAGPGAALGLEPADLVESIYRRAMTGADAFDRRTRAQYLSRQLVRLIVQDEQESARRQEPGKLEYSLLSGGQDELVIADLQVAEISRQQDRASVRVRFRNSAAGRRAPVETVTYQLQAGDQGWRITNIIYNPQQNLLGTLSR